MCNWSNGPAHLDGCKPQDRVRGGGEGVPFCGPLGWMIRWANTTLVLNLGQVVRI